MAIRTASMEDVGPLRLRQLDDLEVKLDDAPDITKAEWDAVFAAADNSMGGDKQDRIGVQVHQSSVLAYDRGIEKLTSLFPRAKQ